jgi:enamine deaminase RidA (YjgF/YER057c/UK114 family)
MNREQKLIELKIELPTAAKPAGAYVPVVQAGNLLFVSGQLPIQQGKLLYTGKVGVDLDAATGQLAAKLCAINALAALKGHLASLDCIQQIVRLEVFVNSAPSFFEQAAVANGASHFLHEVFGPAGQHARLAVGVAELPLNAAVEIAIIVSTSDASVTSSSALC